MKSLRLKNFRCLEDTGEIEFSPLTFLVGKNGSGKSSFLYSFNLFNDNCLDLKWADKTSYGSIKKVMKRDAGNMEMSFSLENVKMPNDDGVSINKNVKVTLKYVIVDECVKLNYVIIHIDEKEIEMRLKAFPYEYDMVKIGDVDSYQIQDELCFSHSGGFLPFVKFNIPVSYKDILYSYSAVCIQEIKRIIEKYTYRKTTSHHKKFLKETKEETKSNIDTFSYSCFTDEDFNYLHDLFYYREINFIIDAINKHIKQLKENIVFNIPNINSLSDHYIIKLYNSSFKDVFSYVDNIASYLYRLSDTSMNDLNSMLLKYFNFSVKIKISNDRHAEIIVVENGEEYNVADKGSGYMNILYLSVRLWKVVVKKQEDVNEYIVIIEHPEMCLHPCLQARFVSFLVNIIKQAYNRNKDIRFMIETHSEMILNKIGDLIAFHKLSKDDVNVYMFNAKSEGKQNYVERAGYDEKGYLTNWPIGFFAEDDDQNLQ